MDEERISPTDFTPSYINVRRNGDADDIYPKIVNWVIDSPLIYNSMQVNVTVLQRQMEEDEPWTFIASIKANDHTLSTSEDLYETDQYAQEGIIDLEETYSWEETIDAIYDCIDQLLKRHWT